jgi:NDP-sugar pyrophosphorylase family protein
MSESLRGHMKAVILAGGKGTRLLPYTIVIPKPMLPIAGIPIIEIIARQLKYYGFDDVTISLGHLSGMIKIFLEGKLEDNSFPLFKYHEENEPRGTSGPIKELGIESDNFVVMNGDILTNINLKKLFDFHVQKKATLTIGVRKTSHKLPFGSVTIGTNDQVTNFEEKPNIEIVDNIGSYVYSQRALSYIDVGEKIDVNTLVLRLIEAGEIVCAFMNEGPYYWIDIGTHADYEKANEELHKILQDFPFLPGVAK